jgi:hypothetical protein
MLSNGRVAGRVVPLRGITPVPGAHRWTWGQVATAALESSPDRERFAAWVLEVYRWGYEASTRVAAPSRESRIERISSAVPTKIGVSRSV